MITGMLLLSSLSLSLSFPPFCHLMVFQFGLDLELPVASEISVELELERNSKLK